MEITFQNKREDFQAFYDYMVKETEQGRAVSKQMFRNWLIWAIVVTSLFGSIVWGATGKFLTGFGLGALVFLLGGTLRLAISGFKPIYYAGVQVYKSQEKFITPKELQVFQLPRTISINDDWLDIQNSESVHRWRWRRVDKIGLTPNFVFIHVGNCPVVYVPKRDFPSEQSFIEFGKKLLEMKEKSKDQEIGAK
jgi:hypothetical protein